MIDYRKRYDPAMMNENIKYEKMKIQFFQQATDQKHIFPVFPARVAPWRKIAETRTVHKLNVTLVKPLNN